ncbi:hypothetical protein HHK36_030001 [Tetracentron sinense]|uniref:GDSL esterase/lipase n=1 Tax=Tetracentron sinense TaxID=13715 RepID=A0A835CZV3_TETSI|nr:hypothetical protein HHK36_030001 [Tetracentron sinense]
MGKFLLISLFALFVSVLSHNVSAIFSFGDSLFDAGNNHFKKNCTAQADFPPYGSSFFHYPTGRFTNRRTVVDFVSNAAQYLGIDFQKLYLEVEMQVVIGSRRNYPSNGINFASGGSGVLRETNMASRCTWPSKRITISGKQPRNHLAWRCTMGDDDPGPDKAIPGIDKKE